MVWLRRNQYLVHMQSVEGLGEEEEEEAVAKWEEEAITIPVVHNPV